jgi:hypothetical protein
MVSAKRNKALLTSVPEGVSGGVRNWGIFSLSLQAVVDAWTTLTLRCIIPMRGKGVKLREDLPVDCLTRGYSSSIIPMARR